MVFRERQEKVSFLDARTKVVARVQGLDVERVFGDIVAGYAREVFQETYDADLLRRRLKSLQRVQGRIQSRRREDQRQISRLSKMGEFYDKKFGTDFKAPKKPTGTPR